MADFLVLEEDGTSHLELEENTDDFLLEESSPVERAASFEASAFVSTTTPPDPPSDAHWKVGTITVPGSTGTQAITGLGGVPRAVFFWGTNWLTEDAAVTSGQTGLFRGMASTRHDDPGTIDQTAGAFVLPFFHYGTELHAIMCFDATTPPGTFRYRADLDSFDADGFTLDWLNVTAGGYKVVYAALMDVTNAGSFVATDSATESLGWTAGASLLQGGWVFPQSTSNRVQMFFGGGAYPASSSADWTSAGLSAFCFPTATLAQYNIGAEASTPGTSVAQGGNFIGPFFVTQNVSAIPSGPGLTEFTLDTHTTDNGAMVVAWDDQASEAGEQTPATTTGGTATVSGLPFRPGLVTGYTISNEPPGQGTGGRMAMGFSVVADGFQWTASVDRFTGGSVAACAFQSFQRGIVDVVDGSSVHTASVVLTADGFVSTTEEDDVSPAPWAWHAFGHPDVEVMWIPQIYRRQPF
jgi:hypothetical protein